MTEDKISDEFKKRYGREPTGLEILQFKGWYEADKRIRWWTKPKKIKEPEE